MIAHFHYRVRETPWGKEYVLWEGPRVTVKLIRVDPGSRLSLQSHQKRDEVWVILAPGSVQQNDHARELGEGEMVTIPRGMKHRLGAGTSVCRVLEISHGVFDQDDIIRYEDDYGRA